MADGPAETDETLAFFDALAWRLGSASSGARPGAQRGRLHGSGGDFVDAAPLMAHPDPRRLDLRRSIVDPFGALKVRRFETRTGVTAHVLLDASASLAVAAKADRRGLAALLAAGLAQAAVRAGDRFALAAARGDGAEPLLMPPTRRRGLGREVFAAVAELTPQGRGVDELIAQAAEIPLQRTVTFLISDFELLPDELDRLLNALEGRALVPIWLRDSGLDAVDGSFGLCDVVDPETGSMRTVLMRRAWAAAYREARVERQRELTALLADHGRNPVVIADALDVAILIADLAGRAL